MRLVVVAVVDIHIEYRIQYNMSVIGRQLAINNQPHHRRTIHRHNYKVSRKAKEEE